MTQAEFETSLMLLGFGKVLLDESNRCKGNWRAYEHNLYVEVFDDCANIIRLYKIAGEHYSLTATDSDPSTMLDLIVNYIARPK